MRRIGVFILTALLSLSVYADAVLGGAPISSEGATQASKAFDGNSDTYFQASVSSYGWVGLDFGRAYVITSVGWEVYESSKRSLLGIFEGANRADFRDAVPLKIISEESLVGQMNYAQISCTKGFRYVRYVGPDGQRCRVRELRFKGNVGAGSTAQLCQLTNLPVVSIHTENGQIPEDKVTDIPAYITVISNNGRTQVADSATIRLRGNASRSFPKKPYRIKFAQKHNILGSPASARKWTLINNYGDKTLMRNQLAFELSRRLGMPYTPFCAYVDVVLNGEYKGCYQLCDQIEVRKGRVDITEILPEDKSGTALTGGYLIEVDAYAYDEEVSFNSSKGTPVAVKSPDGDEIISEQYNYIQNQYNLMERYPDTYLDRNTFLRHFLVGELSGNTDTYWSVYMYKQRGDDMIYTGPVWDFDLAFENDNRTYPINNKTDYIYRTCGSTVGYMRDLTDKVVFSAAGKQMLYDIWAAARQNGLTKANMLDYVDRQAQLLEQSQRLNFIRWPIMNTYVHQNPRLWGSYDAEVENVRNYIKKRFDWMDKKIGYTSHGVEEVENGESRVESQKILRDGQLFIIRNGAVYTTSGLRVE